MLVMPVSIWRQHTESAVCVHVCACVSVGGGKWYESRTEIKPIRERKPGGGGMSVMKGEQRKDRGAGKTVGQRGHTGLCVCVRVCVWTYVFVCACPRVFVLANLGVSSFLRLLC